MRNGIERQRGVLKVRLEARSAAHGVICHRPSGFVGGEPEGSRWPTPGFSHERPAPRRPTQPVSPPLPATILAQIARDAACGGPAAPAAVSLQEMVGCG